MWLTLYRVVFYLLLDLFFCRLHVHLLEMPIAVINCRIFCLAQKSIIFNLLQKKSLVCLLLTSARI